MTVHVFHVLKTNRWFPLFVFCGRLVLADAWLFLLVLLCAAMSQTALCFFYPFQGFLVGDTSLMLRRKSHGCWLLLESTRNVVDFGHWFNSRWVPFSYSIGGVLWYLVPKWLLLLNDERVVFAACLFSLFLFLFELRDEFQKRAILCEGWN